MSDKDRVLLREILEKLDEILAILKQRPTVTPAGWTPPPEGEWVFPDKIVGTAGRYDLWGDE